LENLVGDPGFPKEVEGLWLEEGFEG